MTEVAQRRKPDPATDKGPAHGVRQEKPNIYARLARFSAARPITVIVIYVLLAAAGLLAAALWLDIDTDPQRMIAGDLPFRYDIADFNRQFPGYDNTFVLTVEADDPEVARDAARSLAHAFEARPGLFKAIYAPGTSEFFDRYGILYLPTEDVARIVGELHQALPTISELAQNPNLNGLARLVGEIRQVVERGASPPGIAGFFSAASRTVDSVIEGSPVPLDWATLGLAKAPIEQKRWYLVVKPKLDYTSLEPAQAALRSVHSVINEQQLNNDGRVRIAVTGEAAINAEELRTVTGGAALAAFGSLAIVAVIILVGFPAFRLVIPPIVMLVLGFCITAGFATLTIGYLNLISVAFAVLFIGLGVDYSVHIILRYWEEAHDHHKSVVEAIGDSAQHTGSALAVCLFATMAAFLAFTITDFVGMAQLGIIAAAGIATAFIASITLIPAILVLLGRPEGRSAGLWAKMHTPEAVRRLWILRAGATTVVLALAALAVFAIPKVAFDGDPVNLKDPRSPEVVEFDRLLADAPGQVYAAQVLAPPGEPARKLAAELGKLPVVAQVRSIESFVPADQNEKLAELATLQGLIPEVAATSDIGAEARRAALDLLKEDVQAISTSEAAPHQLKEAAERWHQSLVRFDNPKPASLEAMAQLERSFFGKLPELLQRLQQLALLTPVSLENLDSNLKEQYVAPDGRWRLEAVPSIDLHGGANLERFTEQVKTVAPHATGAPIEIAASAEAVGSSMVIATAAAFVLAILLMLPLMGRILDVALVLAPLVLATLLLLGYTVVTGHPFNFANILVLPLLVGIGVDASIHYVARAREEEGGHEIAGTSTPHAVVLSALMTIGSFGTLWLSSHRGLSSMGELLTIAILITLICTLLVLPQLIAWTIGRKVQPLTGQSAAPNRGRRGDSRDLPIKTEGA